MTARLGRIVARLAEPVEQVSAELVRKINENINPPTPVTADDVFVRAMYVVSDQVNSFGGRFPADEHARLAELLVDSPVLAGHRKDKLPLARTFHAVTLSKDNVHWVKSYFYWVRAADGADSLRDNIDGGLFKECSIGFTFSFAECSICGRDIRRCDHQPLEQYELDGVTKDCHFNYRQIDRVLETSLVYRGATPGTRVSRELAVADQAPAPQMTDWLPALENMADLPPADRYLVMPYYESVPIRLSYHNHHLEVARLDSAQPLSSLPPHLHRRIHQGVTERNRPLEARLVGYRGKERCSLDDVAQSLAGQQSQVSRLVAFLVPDPVHRNTVACQSNQDIIRVMPHRVCDRRSLVRTAGEIMTRDGVEVWALGEDDPQGFRLPADQIIARLSNRYVLYTSPHHDRASLVLHLTDETVSFSFRQFHLGRFRKGCRLIGHRIDNEHVESCESTHPVVGAVKQIEQVGGAISVDCDGPLSGRLCFRPARLHGQQCVLVYRTDRAGSEGGNHEA
ncbi:hypothetical protein GF420_07820 [candidate division GN15 bacterium]|nr:hypothetical protein [candidate division GN15 bacterium]